MFKMISYPIFHLLFVALLGMVFIQCGKVDSNHQNGTNTIAETDALFENSSIRIPVLCYHTFRKDFSSFINLNLNEFENQMKMIKENGFTAIDLRDLEKIKKGQVKSPAKPVVITFDDGHNTATAAWKIMKKYGLSKAVFYIYPGVISRKAGHYTWEEIAGLYKDGVDIESHGYFHEFFTKQFPKEDKKTYQKRILWEIAGSKKTIEEKLKAQGITHKVEHLAYPFGDFNSDTQKWCLESGYKSMTDIAGNVNTMDTEMSQLSRFMVTTGTSVKELKNWMESVPLRLEKTYPRIGETVSNKNIVAKIILGDLPEQNERLFIRLKSKEVKFDLKDKNIVSATLNMNQDRTQILEIGIRDVKTKSIRKKYTIQFNS